MCEDFPKHEDVVSTLFRRDFPTLNNRWLLVEMETSKQRCDLTLKRRRFLTNKQR